MAGIFSGTISTSYAYVSEIVPTANIPKYMSYMSATMSSCFVIGPLIGGGLAQFGIRVPFYMSTLFAFFALVNCYFYILDPQKLQEQEEKSIKDGRKSLNLDGGSYSKVDGDEQTATENEVRKEETEKEPEEKIKPKNPYSDWRVVATGVFGTFFNSFAFSGLAVLIPLWMTRKSFGIVKGDPDALNQEDSENLALYVGYLLGFYGVVQALTMIFLFPYLVKKSSIMHTGTLGAILHGVGLILIPSITKYEYLIPVYLLISSGNGLIRPSFPAFLGSIAPKGSTGSYIAVNSLFINLAMMCGGQLSVLYDWHAQTSFYVAAVVCLANAVILGFVARAIANGKKKEEEISESQIEVTSSEKTSKEYDFDKMSEFFGKADAKTEDQFFADLREIIINKLIENNFEKSLIFSKGQTVLTEIITEALPVAPAALDEKFPWMRDLYASYGHIEWAEGLEEVAHIKHVDFSSISIPGRN